MFDFQETLSTSETKRFLMVNRVLIRFTDHRNLLMTFIFCGETGIG